MTEYNEKWENDIDPNGVPYKMWCKRHNATSAWCRLCKRVLSVKVMGICAIRQHAGRKSHKKRLGEIQKEENEQNQQNETIEWENNHLEKDDSIDTKITKAEISWSLLFAEHDLAFLVNDHTTPMFPIMFNDSAIAAGYKCCRTKMRYIVTHGLSKTFKSLLDKKLTETVFSLQIDESNKMYGKKFLIMIVKFYDNELEKITTRFLELKVANKGNASSIVQAILGTFQQHDIPFTNMIQIMSDSPAVMRGKYQGVVTQFRNEHSPHIIDLGGCLLHHVSNAVRNATDKLYKAGDIEEFLQDICTFFNNHVEFAEEFDDLQR